MTAASASVPSSSTSSQVPWYLDSATTDNITNDLSNLNCYQPYHHSEQITIGNGNSIPIHHTSNGLLPTPHYSFKLQNILHFDFMTSNLVSIQKLAQDNNYVVILDAYGFVIQDKLTRKVLHKGTNFHGLYHFLPLTTSAHHVDSPQAHFRLSPSPVFTVSTASSSLWHHRLGYPSPLKLQHLTHHLGIKLSKQQCLECIECSVSKSHKVPFHLSNSTVNKPLSLIHSDV